MNLSWRDAADADLDLLAEWNHQLIRDEAHRNAMTVPQLRDRLQGWLARREYRAVVFSTDVPVGHAVFKQDPELIYLRQFFIRRDQRNGGLGHAAFSLLKQEVWPSGIRLTVDVLCQNEAALAFWRSVGYRDYCLTLEIMP